MRLYVQCTCGFELAHAQRKGEGIDKNTSCISEKIATRTLVRKHLNEIKLFVQYAHSLQKTSVFAPMGYGKEK